MKTALRLKKIADAIDVNVQRMVYVANKIPAGAEERLIEEAKKKGIEIDAIVPFDTLIPEYDLEGRPILDLPDNAPSVIAVKWVVEHITKE
jgi:CO dehydrogenase maturation factor